MGCSNFAGWQLADADWTSRSGGFARYVTAQNEYNLLDRRIERELVPACRRYGVGILPYFPLASGFLTGKYTRGQAPSADTRLANAGVRGERLLTEPNFDRIDALSTFASERGHTLLELAIGWLASQPHVSSVIAGATRAEQVAANARAAGWALSESERAEISALVPRESA